MNNHRKKLIYQSWHRGCKETDDVLGPFADSYLISCTDAETTAFEALLNEDDWDIWRWLTSKQPMPEEHAAMLERIKTFQQAKHA